MHRLEHLGGNDDGNRACARLAGDLLLDAWYALERQLQSEIPASDHDGVTCRKNVVDVVNGLRAFELGHKRRTTCTRSVQQVARLLKIGSGLDKAQRDV